MDACDLHTHPHLAAVWQRRGAPLIVPAAGVDQRRVVFGALDEASGQLVWQLHDRQDGAAVAALLEQVAQTWPAADLLVVMDTGSDHRAPAVRTWWAAQAGRRIPFWLPVSAPMLNLIERVWRFLKHKLAGHRCWADVAGLQAAAAVLLDRIEAHVHPDQQPAIRLVPSCLVVQ